MKSLHSSSPSFFSPEIDVLVCTIEKVFFLNQFDNSTIIINKGQHCDKQPVGRRVVAQRVWYSCY